MSKDVQGSERPHKTEELETITPTLHWRLKLCEYTATMVNFLAEITPPTGILVGIFSQFRAFLYS